MNIIVCVKQVPDTTARKQLGPDFLLNRGELDPVVNPFDEYALEEALRLREAHGGEVVVVTMGPPSAEDSIRKTLATGADRAVLVTDDALRGSDWRATCRVLAEAIRRQPFDLILTGMESTDARSGLVPGGLAEMLGIPAVTYAASLEWSGEEVRVNRQIPGGFVEVTARPPLLVSVVKGANLPRYPSLKGIMAAKRKEIRKYALGDLGLAPDDVGLRATQSPVVAATPRPEKQAGRVARPATPEEAAETIADFLAESKYI